MHTTCPECQTSFRVSQEQLGLRRGLVRCGKCNAVFNAYDALLPELSEPPPQPLQPQRDALSDPRTGWEDEGPARLDIQEAAPPVPQPAAQEAGEWTTVGTGEPAQPRAPEAEPAPAGMTANDGGPSADPDATVPREAQPDGEQTPGPEAGKEPARPAPADTPDAILLSELPNRRPAAPGLPGWKKALYGLASVLLLVLLVGQTALFLRAELAAAFPATRPALISLCAPLGCQVPLPRELDQRAIASSNLEHDPEQKSRVRLTFLLANRTGQTQTWPVVALTLTDVRETPVAQKLFGPETYLPKDSNIPAGMAADQEREVRLDLDIGNLAATGYALSLVYP